MTVYTGAFPVDTGVFLYDTKMISHTIRGDLAQVGQLCLADSGGSFHDANHLCTQLRTLFGLRSEGSFGGSRGGSILATLTRLSASLDRASHLRTPIGDGSAHEVGGKLYLLSREPLPGVDFVDAVTGVL